MIATQKSEGRYLGFEKKKMFLRLKWWRDTD